MPSTYIDYGRDLTPQEAYNNAIEDCKEWFGEEKFAKITEQFREEFPCGMSLESFRMYMHLAGIQGFPVGAMYDHVYPFG